MVLALLIGIALNRPAAAPIFQPGLTFCVKKLLRWAVALLGLRIALGDIVDLGVPRRADGRRHHGGDDPLGLRARAPVRPAAGIRRARRRGHRRLRRLRRARHHHGSPELQGQGGGRRLRRRRRERALDARHDRLSGLAGRSSAFDHLTTGVLLGATTTDVAQGRWARATHVSGDRRKHGGRG